MIARRIFMTGANGYIGSRLVPALLARGHAVTALVRPGREGLLPGACRVVTGNALDAATFQERIGDADTLVHLVGVAHPGPAKTAAFREVDQVSLRAAATAAVHAGVKHFVYLSVAQPAPVMHAYVAVRAAGEALLRESGLSLSILRPWYVLGPGHRWPLVLLPLYALAALFPGTREGAQRLGLVTLDEMCTALISAIEHPPPGARIIRVPDIRAARLSDPE